MRKLFLHIGSHKTASTSIQASLCNNYEWMLSKGILYPRSGRNTLYGHHDLVASLNDTGHGGDLIDSLRGEVAQHNGDVVLSSENFEYMSGRGAERLAHLFRGYSVKVVYFYRRWSPLLYAMWQEEVKHGESVFYHEFCLRHFAFPFSSRVLNHALAVAEFAHVFGKDTVNVFSYDELLNKGNIVELFFNMIGLSNAASDPSRVNESFDPVTVEIIRSLNSIMAARGFRRDYLTKHYYINFALAGEGAEYRKILQDVMNDHLVLTPDFDLGFVKDVVVSSFLRDYSHNGNKDKALTNSQGDIKKIQIVRPDYLLDRRVDVCYAFLADSIARAHRLVADVKSAD